MGTAAFDPSTDSVLMPGYAATIGIDSTSGALHWITDHEGSFSPSSPVVTGRGVVATVGGRGLRLLDRADGRRLWDARVDPRRPSRSSLTSRPATPCLPRRPLLGDRILLPCLDGTVRVFSLDGELLHSILVACRSPRR